MSSWYRFPEIFAINGVASVLGSAVALLIVLQFGFSVGLLVALLGYIAAYYLYGND